ncbi:hypothetical protein CEH05_20560 (plasmid) [Halobacillus halophilus]|nr:hypothetical protein CEH05_20560 [Halobacillus halophilus]
MRRFVVKSKGFFHRTFKTAHAVDESFIQRGIELHMQKGDCSSSVEIITMERGNGNETISNNNVLRLQT